MTAKAITSYFSGDRIVGLFVRPWTTFQEHESDPCFMCKQKLKHSMSPLCRLVWMNGNGASVWSFVLPRTKDQCHGHVWATAETLALLTFVKEDIFRVFGDSRLRSMWANVDSSARKTPAGRFTQSNNVAGFNQQQWHDRLIISWIVSNIKLYKKQVGTRQDLLKFRRRSQKPKTYIFPLERNAERSKVCKPNGCKLIPPNVLGYMYTRKTNEIPSQEVLPTNINIIADMKKNSKKNTRTSTCSTNSEWYSQRNRQHSKRLHTL